MGNTFTFSEFSQPKSLDEFNINIIDLRSKEIWYTHAKSPDTINKINDFLNLKIMLEKIQSTITIIVFPQNINFQYNYGYSPSAGDSKYLSQMELKNNLSSMTKNIISKLIPNFITEPNYTLFYENTSTIINGIEFTASFNFEKHHEAVTLSKSSKVTTIQRNNNFYFTTLDILSSEEHLMGFLKECKLISDKEEYPQWLHEYKILNDNQLSELVKEKENIIENAKDEIKVAKDNLNSNLEYKSILYTNDKQLENQIIKMLEQVLNVDLSSFIDEKNEDFLIEIGDSFEFIGEIKGISSNIRSEHISQLEVHYRKRLDELQEKKITKKIKALLIINPLRRIPINDREAVHENQIKLAERNESLIITTKSLLNIYEFFVSDKSISKKCIEMFKNEIGLLTDDMIHKYFGE